MADVILCPHCGRQVEITQAVAAGLRKQIESETLAGFQAKERELEAKGQVLAEREAQAAAAARRIEQTVKAQVEAQTAQAAVKAKAEAQAAAASELAAAHEQAKAMRAERDSAQAKELALRKERGALDDEKRAWELLKMRQLDEDRVRIAEVARKEAEEASRLPLEQARQQIAGMAKRIEDLKRNAEQGSMQLQGEAQEISLEDALRREFPGDLIEPVPKGVRGADLIHHVRSPAGVEAGVILWEFKHTKAWAGDWLPKLRDDQRALRAELAALVSEVLPAGVAPVALLEGVWVAVQPCALGLAALLRKALLDVAGARRAADGRGEKKDLIYGYLTGPQFKNRVEGLLEPFLAMRAELDAERRAIEKGWARREKQIQRALASVSGLHGDLEGIIGNALPEIRQLALPAPEEGERGLAGGATPAS